MTCSTLCTFQNEANSIVQILPDYAESFKNGNFDGLFHQYQGVIINSLVTAFGLDRILFSDDKDGGNIQTIHNAEKMGNVNISTYKYVHPSFCSQKCKRIDKLEMQRASLC